MTDAVPAAAITGACPLCGCDLECRGCYCHEDPDDKSYQAGAAAERERLAAVLEAIVERRSDAEFARRLDAIRDRKPLHDALEAGPPPAGEGAP